MNAPTPGAAANLRLLAWAAKTGRLITHMHKGAGKQYVSGERNLSAETRASMRGAELQVGARHKFTGRA